jgi:predicted GH43/DUF377 family glycosyl hydrolase
MALQLTRYERNPIVAPRPGFEWEHRGTFNPGAIIDRGRIHVLYRAVDSSGVSRLGYVSTSDGLAPTFRSPKPVLCPGADYEEFGCEDPRITNLDGVFYITYTAYSRRGQRVGLASTRDFVEFKKLGLVGPNMDDKDCVIFPEKIGGKVVVLHRLKFGIQIAYLDSFPALARSDLFWSDHVAHVQDCTLMEGEQPWEVWKVGAGPPPIKTERGWLLIYHGVSAQRVYGVGAALLDLNNPSRILSRTRNPILTPETTYEREGCVPNVVFPCGSIVQDGTLIVYYGGADTVCGVATVNLDDFLDAMIEDNLT